MRIDFHVHSLYSEDAFSSPKELSETAFEIGLDGFALTDHETTSGWEEAKKSAKKYGLFFIPGQEIKTEKGDVLALFIERKIKSKKFLKVVREIKIQKGIVVIPHPFHPFECFKDDLRKYRNLIDGIEVFNSRGPLRKPDEKAFDLAISYGFATLGGSDAHHKNCLGDGWTFVEGENLLKMKENILSQKTFVFGEKSPFFYLLVPSFKRILKKFSKS